MVMRTLKKFLTCLNSVSTELPWGIADSGGVRGGGGGGLLELQEWEGRARGPLLHRRDARPLPTVRPQPSLEP